MVSTRHHPRDFSTPERTKPSKSPSPSRGGSTDSGGANNNDRWVHTPSAAITLWLVLSVPLVLWDSGYVLLRPHSMPGHKLHSPLWTPYALYGTIDYIYGWPAFNARNGFTAAQTMMNLVESAAYVYYLGVVYRHGVSVVPTSGRGKPAKQQKKGIAWFLKDEKVVSGRIGASALLIAYTASVMTLGKTIIYWMNEYFSGFDNIGHNDLVTLIFLWIIPNGLWIVFPAYIVYAMGRDIISSLESAATLPKSRQSKSS